MAGFSRVGPPHPRQEQVAPQPRPAFSGAAVVWVLAGGVIVYLLRHILLLFVLPLIVAYVCSPVIGWLARWLRLKRWAAALISPVRSCRA